MKFRKGWIVGVMLVLAQGAVAELSNGLYAAFDTTMGSFTCRLDYAEAPLTCANFAGLAEGSQSWVAPQTGGVQADPFYDDLIFHRVITNFMIQGGCPIGNGTSGPGYAIPDEFSTNLTHHSAGVLSMANSGPDSGGSQFFITLNATSHLDNQHAVFGEVVDGMDVVFSIGAVATDAARPLTNVVMNTIQILRIGSAAEAFDPVDQPLPEVSPLNLSITNALSGMNVIAATSNQCEQTVYASTNLLEWASSAKKYSPTSHGDWVVPTASNLNAEFFRGTRVFHPQAVTMFSNLEGRTLMFSQEGSTLEFSPEASGSGSCDIAGTPDSLIYWEEWTTVPYLGRVVFQPSSISAFLFLLERSGECSGYQNSADGWQYIGEWRVGDPDATPE